MKKMIFQIGILLFLIGVAFGSCQNSKKALEVTDEERIAFSKKVGDTIEIKSDSTEYEIIIIEPGFNFWLNSIARPEGFYSQPYLENRNQILVINWNQRVLQPLRFNSNLYELQINYDPNIDYGYEVNYKLYNYFIYFQRKYNQRLGPWLPRI
jgi:signal peptidase I